MESVINLQLADPNAYKRPMKAQFSNLSLIDVIFEILGSIVKIMYLSIYVIIEKDHILIHHNSSPIDQNDIERLKAMATTNITDSKKGVSSMGCGLRSIASVFSGINFDETDIDFSEINKFSSMTSRVDTEIDIDGEKIHKGEIISIIFDNDYKIKFSKNEKLKEKYIKNLKKENGVMFIIPNTFNYYHNMDQEICHKLRILFHRLDCEFNYKNKINGDSHIFEKDLFADKPPMYITNTIPDAKYLEIECELFSYMKHIILKMKFIDHKDINGIDTSCEHYFDITYTDPKELSEKYDYDEWKINIENPGNLKKMNLVFRSRMMGFDPDKQLPGTEFSKWYAF